MERPRPSPPPHRVLPLRVRELLPFALLAVACSAAMRQPFGCTPPPAPSPIAPSAEGRAVSLTSPEAGSVFAALSARGPSLAPGMREVTRNESAGDPVELARAEGRDACVRVAFEATAPVVATLSDAEGNVLASSVAPTVEGVLGPRGPVCIRRGDRVSARAEGADAGAIAVRWVAWEGF
jgi:hypothetical protein